MASRQIAPARKGTAMRPPAVPRPGVNRAQTATPTLNGRSTPIDSMGIKQRSPKRKAAEMLESTSGLEETNINVVVRCRGRNDREVRENSAVVVSSDGIKGSKVELSMGPNALSNKAYQFDKVFSPAADQEMVYDEVVAPVLDEVLAGFNCTIFAYGQTGTGKTYTMSGDISDILPIPEAAGIIPRVLHDLFNKLNNDETTKLDTSVKCSFIELYNEELRDLLAVDDSVKLKIFDDANKNGRTTTLIQGMEETYIENASKGIRLLSDGSMKRQVAATKCNDLSSRSHTVFTMTIYTKRLLDSGEEFISASKLNLVDLAGSENIQRSGAENKRATEAGLINKSLLTLGRVINALVDRSSHIPYRESKLTRLLQDSLGGRTKTCIIATLSPAKSNLEETISTLDYAFRAKNIRNKPQMNQLVSKKTLLREFTSEIEKLKSELIATRHRNGYYLTAEAYEELTTQSESRRILSEEQRDKIETMENNLRNKVQELYNLTTSLQTSKKDNDKIKGRLASTRDLLDNTELVLGHAKRSLAEEVHFRKAYAETESRLFATSREMQSTLQTATADIGRLHDKVLRQHNLHEANRSHWDAAITNASTGTATARHCLEQLQQEQTSVMQRMTDHMATFLRDELANVRRSQSSAKQHCAAYITAQGSLEQEDEASRAEREAVLGEVEGLRENAKNNVSSGLDELAITAERISQGIAQQLGELQTVLLANQDAIKQQISTAFDDVDKQIMDQWNEMKRLKTENELALAALTQAKSDAKLELQKKLDEADLAVEAEQQILLGQIGSLIEQASKKRQRQLVDHYEYAAKRMKTSEDEYQLTTLAVSQGMNKALTQSMATTMSIYKHKKEVDSSLDAGQTRAEEQLIKVIDTTSAVYAKTTQAIDEQKMHMDTQLASLDDVVDRVRAHNDLQRTAHASALASITSTVQQSYAEVDRQYEGATARLESFGSLTAQDQEAMRITIAELGTSGKLQTTLSSISEAIDEEAFAEYEATGATPTRTTYHCPSVLPQTQPRDVIVDAMRGPGSLIEAAISPAKSPTKRSPRKRLSPTKIPVSPSKTQVFSDITNNAVRMPPMITLQAELLSSPTQTLREMDANIPPSTLDPSSDDGKDDVVSELISLKGIANAARKTVGKVEKSKRASRTVDGRENLGPSTKITSSRRSLRNRGIEQS